VSVHPWLEASLLGLVVVVIAWRARAASAQG
jgi:hypothetical protein